MINVYFIFGAHSRARTLAEYMRITQPQMKLAAFMCDNDEANPEEIEGVPVIRLSETVRMRDIEGRCGLVSFEEEAASTVAGNAIFLAIRGIYHEAVMERLKRLGFTNIIPVTVSFDTHIRTAYLKKRFEDEKKDFVKIDDLEVNLRVAYCGDILHTACIFEVRSVYDKSPEKDSYERAPYERSIQVGMMLTEQRLENCDYRDDEGDNISALNRCLCEETALYWIWKHAKEDVIGLVHYRRHFYLPEDWEQRMRTNGIDVILPIPLYVGPNIAENYRFRHVAGDWDILMQLIRETSEEEYQAAQKCFSGNLYCPCNMFVMKREVMQEYCAWLFPILFGVMERIGEREDAYQNRYPAFMAERLLTLYFEMNRERYRIVYADKGFLL